MKDNEIEKLKNEITLIQKLKEDLLEKQRLELTNSFQEILHLSEKKLVEKENDLNKQILMIDSKIDFLTNENLKFKKLLQEETLNNDNLSKQMLDYKDKLLQKEFHFNELSQEILLKEKNGILMKQSFENERKQWEAMFENEKNYLQHKLTSAQTEIQTLNSQLQNSDNEISENKKVIATLKQQSSQEVNELFNKYASINSSNKELNSEKEILLEKLSKKLLENEMLLKENNLIAQELSNIKHMYSLTNSEKQDLQSSNQIILNELNSLKLSEKTKEKEAQETVEKLKSSGLQKLESEKGSLVRNYENEINNLKKKFHEEITSFKENYEKQMESVKNENSLYLKELQLKEKEKNELKLETKALQHRMESYQLQLLQFQQKGGTMNSRLPNLDINDHNTNDYIPTKSTELSLADLDFNFGPLSPIASGEFAPNRLGSMLSPQKQQLRNQLLQKVQLNSNNSNHYNNNSLKGIAEKESFARGNNQDIDQENQFLKQTIREVS
jgi:hypothetical protein